MADTTKKLDAAIATLKTKIANLKKEMDDAGDRHQKAITSGDKKAQDQCKKDLERYTREYPSAKKLLVQAERAREMYVSEKKGLAQLKLTDRAEYDRQKVILKKNLKVQFEASLKKVQQKVDKLTAQKKALDTELFNLMNAVETAKATDKKKKEEEYNKKSPALRTKLSEVKTRLPEAKRRLDQLNEAFESASEETDRHAIARKVKMDQITDDMPEAERKRRLQEVKEMDEQAARNYETILKSLGAEK
jgi:hypothetical protein